MGVIPVDRRRYLGAALAVALVALALRLGPLHWGPLPFNPDGIGYAARARDAVATGGIDLDGTATDALGYTAALAVVARATGIPPLYVAQPASAVVGAATVVLCLGVGRRAARAAGLSPGRARWAAVFGALLLAVDGLYVYRTMAVDEQTADVLAVPAVVLAAALALRPDRTDRRRWAALAVGGFVLLPPLHNLAGVVAAMAVTVLAGLWVARDPSLRTWVGGAGLVAVAWTWALGYHAALAALTPATVVQSERLARAPGLFLAWVVLGVLGTVWFVTTTRRRQRAVLGTVVVGWFLVLAVNAVVVVYPGTTTTPRPLLLALAPLAVPGLVSVAGVPDLVRAGWPGDAVLALVGAAGGLVGFGLTAGLTPEYLATVYRAQLFVHLPLAVAVGVATVRLAGRIRGRIAGSGGTGVGGAGTGDGTPGSPTGRSDDRGSARGSREPDPGATDAPGVSPDRRSTLADAAVVVVAVGLVACTAAGVPAAFSGLELLTYKGVTTPAEFAGTEFASEERPGAWATDDHLVRVAGYHRGELVEGFVNRSGGSGATEAPVRSWLLGSGPPPRCAVLAQDSWTTTGAQFHPRQPERLDPGSYRRWRATRNVVYAAGHRDPVVLVVPRNGSGSC